MLCAASLTSASAAQRRSGRQPPAHEPQPAAQPVAPTAASAGGVLGRTADELARCYGVSGQEIHLTKKTMDQEDLGPIPDLRRDPVPPAVTALTFASPRTTWLACVGFNAEGKAIYVKTHARARLQSDRDVIANCIGNQGYAFAVDSGAQWMFPSKTMVDTLTRQTPIWEGGPIVWTWRGGERVEVLGNYEHGNSRTVYRDQAGVAYAFYDYCWNEHFGPRERCGPLMVCDANTFWTWMIGDRIDWLLHGYNSREMGADEVQYDFGPIAQDVTQPGHPVTYDHEVDALTALSAAFREIIWNPAVSDQLVERTITALFKYGDRRQVLADLKRTAAGPNPVARGRAEFALWRPEVEALLRGGGDVNGFLLLHQVASIGGIRKAAFLVEHGAKVNLARPGDGCTPLHIAALNGRADVVEFLLAQGADVNGAAANGRTALHFAAAAGDANQGVVTLLLNAGAASEAKDGAGLAPADVAEQAGHQELARYLRGRVSPPERKVDLPPNETKPLEAR